MPLVTEVAMVQGHLSGQGAVFAPSFWQKCHFPTLLLSQGEKIGDPGTLPGCLAQEGEVK
jgi:hypothetical protein